MNNKILTIILIILLLGLVSFSYYLYSSLIKCKNTVQDLGTQLEECVSGPNQPEAESNNVPAEETKIISIYLEKFPAGTQMGPDAKGTITTTFKKDELMGIKGEIVLAEDAEKATITLQIIDENEEIVQDGSSGIEAGGSGGFGACCINFPTTAGQYTLKVFLDEEEAESLPFEVVP